MDVLCAARYFAVVIEEACEVMEPTLMSLLVVQSFVQSFWFNFEAAFSSLKKTSV